MELVYTVVEAVKSNICSVGQQGGDPEGQDVGQIQKHLLEKLSFLREVSLLCSSFQLPRCGPPTGRGIVPYSKSIDLNACLIQIHPHRSIRAMLDGLMQDAVSWTQLNQHTKWNISTVIRTFVELGRWLSQ